MRFEATGPAAALAAGVSVGVCNAMNPRCAVPVCVSRGAMQRILGVCFGGVCKGAGASFHGGVGVVPAMK